MKFNLKLSERPYTVTSIVFLLIIFYSFLFMNWTADYYSYLLILYFIVTLGIRLDDISKQIGCAPNSDARHRPSQISDDEENVINLLNEIKITLKKIEKKLE